MIKKCIVEFDEYHNPINVVEIKEFRSARELQDFVKVCNENRAKAKEKYDEILSIEREEKEKLCNRLELAIDRIDVLTNIVKALLGKVEYTSEDVDRLLEAL